MSLLNTPTDVDTYFMPADAAAAKAATLALINAAATKIRLAMFTLTDADFLTAIIAAQTRGVANIMVTLDWSQAHMHWEMMAITTFRLALTPAKVVYTTSSVHHWIAHNTICTIDDTHSVEGSTTWTLEAWQQSNQLVIIHNATLAAANSAIIDAAAAYGLAHIPQT